MSIDKLTSIENEIQLKINELKTSSLKPTIIAVSKTFPIENILPLIKFGHAHFGENKVQEAINKWTGIKADNKDIKLHLIGPLQTNKVKLALKIFDYIHSVDREKLAIKIADEQNKQNKKIKIFIQINIANEEQKSGVKKEKVYEFFKFCKNLHLDVVGTMCIPPQEGNPKSYFLEMNKINEKLNLPDLSMGMSKDYLEATENKATFLRIGSKIFGQRN